LGLAISCGKFQDCMLTDELWRKRNKNMHTIYLTDAVAEAVVVVRSVSLKMLFELIG